MKCARCGKEFEETPIIIVEMGVKDEKGHAISEDYCAGCAMHEIMERICGLPIAIEVPDLRGYTIEEIGGGAINYVAELVDLPEIKGWLIELR